MPWLRTGRPDGPAAQRSGAGRRSVRGAPRHAPAPRALARGRGPAPPGRGRAECGPARTARHRPIPPFCVTTATASLWVRHRRTAGPIHAQFRPGFLRPLGLQRKVRYVYIHRPTFPRHSVAAARPRLPHLSDRIPSWLSGRGGLPTPRYVGVRGRICTARPTSAAHLRGGRSDPPRPPRPSPGRSGSQGSFRFLRVLPGFSPSVPRGM